MPRPATARVWRLALLWQGTVLDVVTLAPGRRRTLTLRTGETLVAHAVHGGVVVTGLGPDAVVLEAGIPSVLQAGHALLADEDVKEATAGALGGIDATLFHAVMIGAAFQACLVAALVLAPARAFDPEAGAGVQGQYRRLLVATGGRAPERGAPTLSHVGRPAEEGERQALARSSGARPRPTASGRGLTLEESLDAMSRILHQGNGGTELREAVGELAQSVARAPELGAGVGGLSPKDPVETGVGNGLIGAGQSRLAEVLRRRVDRAEESQRQVLPAATKRSVPIPIEVLDVPDAHVTLADAAHLDPEVKEHLMLQVRQRHNSVRHCYEAWGLAGDGKRAGRLTLQVTLRPDGYVEVPVVTVDNPGLKLVGECVERVASEWYLGDGLVKEPQRLSFPFLLQPRR